MSNVPQWQRFLSPAAIGALCFGSPALQGAELMHPGQWEFAMTTDGSTHTASQCITAEKANEVNGDSKSGREVAERNAKGRCAIKSYEIAGEKVTYSLACGTRQIDSVTQFHGDSSDGYLVTTTDGTPVRTEVKAHRLGACP